MVPLVSSKVQWATRLARVAMELAVSARTIAILFNGVRRLRLKRSISFRREVLDVFILSPSAGFMSALYWLPEVTSPCYEPEFRKVNQIFDKFFDKTLPLHFSWRRPIRGLPSARKNSAPIDRAI